uniref:hypothetical chloroplast RF1 n=1 Tax=Polulichloris maxima TaxID=2704661 RepID=UPI002410FB2D|nr:hypothetical chloroplast RF1 [Polulichloris maxima]WDY13203.1 hypothetical chloroplast RF1 [Polulichloris maxima]
MSLATNIKEFADVLHNIYAQQLSSIEGTDIAAESVMSLAIPKVVVLQQASVYLAKSLGHQIFSLLSLQWLRDFAYFPLLSHEMGSSENIMTDTFLSEPASYLFSFSKNGVTLSSPGESKESLSFLFNGFLKSECLLAGFVNSFFFSLPFSLPYLITLRRMFSQGMAAAAASIFGTVAAHSLLLVGVIYGIRFLVIPYYSLQPLTFLIGIVMMAIVITEFVKEKRMYLVPLNHYPSLLRIGIINFIVGLSESATLFHDLHHLTLNQEMSYLQLYPSSSALDSFFSHTMYLIAFVLGHTAFSFLFCYGVLKGNEKVCSLTGWTLPRTVNRINKGLLVAILTLTFSTFPYYGLDYLFTKSVGFLPEDPAYSNTIFSPTQVRSRNRHFKSRAPATKNAKTALELDVNYFDRGMYLNAPKEEKISSLALINQNMGENTYDGLKTPFLDSLTKTPSPESVNTYDPALTFEELNYQGESAWLMRHERAKRLPEEQDSKKPSIFQKPKSHFKELRVKQDNKQAEAALKEGTQIGSISELKEGIRPGFTETTRPPEVKNFKEGERIKPSKAHDMQRKEIDFFAPTVAFAKSAETREAQEENQQRSLVKELFFDREIASSYEKSFTSPFGEEPEGTPPDLLPVENIIKKRYRLNPVYRALLQVDIDSFIARQPIDYKITQNQEVSLFKKRQLLEKYYNSIRYYSPIETTLYATRFGDDKNAFSQVDLTKNPITDFRVRPKSFGEMMYHQQFKGTLHTVKRFFKLSFDEQSSRMQFNPHKNKILSYDQPLYKKRQSTSKNTERDRRESDGATKPKENQIAFKDHPSLHEELSLEKILPFMEESNNAPIYAGWDDKARKFVITNRFNFVVG